MAKSEWKGYVLSEIDPDEYKKEIDNAIRVVPDDVGCRDAVIVAYKGLFFFGKLASVMEDDERKFKLEFTYPSYYKKRNNKKIYLTRQQVIDKVIRAINTKDSLVKSKLLPDTLVCFESVGMDLILGLVESINGDLVTVKYYVSEDVQQKAEINMMKLWFLPSEYKRRVFDPDEVNLNPKTIIEAGDLSDFSQSQEPQPPQELHQPHSQELQQLLSQRKASLSWEMGTRDYSLLDNKQTIYSSIKCRKTGREFKKLDYVAYKFNNERNFGQIFKIWEEITIFGSELHIQINRFYSSAQLQKRGILKDHTLFNKISKVTKLYYFGVFTTTVFKEIPKESFSSMLHVSFVDFEELILPEIQRRITYYVIGKYVPSAKLLILDYNAENNLLTYVKGLEEKEAKADEEMQ